MTRSSVVGRKSIQPTVAAVFDNSRKCDSKSKEACDLNEAVARFICADQVPIYTVEKNGFRSLVGKLNSRYNLPSRKHFMEVEIPKIYESTKSTMKQNLACMAYFASTTDIWTSRTMMSYMSMTVQVSYNFFKFFNYC